ncbi:MAG TPA: aldo/keto reductase [Ramlibacter sp.]|nr:aldo/keto reductase [Ramlibacter sp.]
MAGMRHLMFGRSGLRVSELCLGAMVFGDPRTLGAPADESRAIFDAFAEAGGTFIDTADHYADGASEALVGDFIAAERDRFVVSTKWSVSRHLGIQCSGNGRRNMMRAVEASLRRLKTDRIDLYSLHVWDYATPVEEVMRGLDDLVRSGKVLYVGISDAPAWEISRANMLADLRGWSAFAGLQIEYNLAARTPERDLLPMARALGLGVSAWSPLAGGALSGKYNTGGASGRRGGALPPEVLRIAREVEAVAQERDIAPSHVALAWVRQQGGRQPIVAIVGARTCAQLRDNLRSVAVTLDEDALRRLDEASRIELGFPHDFLRTDYVRTLLHGGEADRMILREPLPHPESDLPMTSGTTKR